MVNHPVFEGDGWMLDLGSLLDYGLGYRFDQGLIVSHAEHDASSVYDAVLFVPAQELLNLLKQAGLLPPADQLRTLESQMKPCLDDGRHDAYLTMCIQGYDYRCRRCGMVRYFDTDPPEWSRENAYRNLENEGYPLNERGEYAGKHPLEVKSAVMMLAQEALRRSTTAIRRTSMETDLRGPSATMDAVCRHHLRRLQ